jgi:general nucleoside transport system permease protein
MLESAADPSLLALTAGFFAAAVRVASPLLVAALGETVSERGGTINLGLEGAMLAGALAAALGAGAGGPWMGVVAAMAAGTVLMIVFALISVRLGADQIITGTALTLAAVGITGAVFRQAYGTEGPGLALPVFDPIAIPILSRIPVLGKALFDQPAPVYAGFLAVPLCWWLLFRTRWGLALRAVGESVEAARASGVRVRWVKSGGLVIGGALGGLAGATLVLAQVGTFAERMTAGRGFVAIAIVVLGRWHPVGVLIAALLFGTLTALQYLFQALGLGVPYQLFIMLPYLLTLLALAGFRGRAVAPAELGKSG